MKYDRHSIVLQDYSYFIMFFLSGSRRLLVLPAADVKISAGGRGAAAAQYPGNRQRRDAAHPRVSWRPPPRLFAGKRRHLYHVLSAARRRRSDPLDAGCQVCAPSSLFGRAVHIALWNECHQTLPGFDPIGRFDQFPFLTWCSYSFLYMSFIVIIVGAGLHDQCMLWNDSMYPQFVTLNCYWALLEAVAAYLHTTASGDLPRKVAALNKTRCW